MFMTRGRRDMCTYGQFRARLHTFACNIRCEGGMRPCGRARRSAPERTWTCTLTSVKQKALSR